jgi:hypothetical protein
MNRWIAALAMGLATAANAPAAGPPVDAQHVIGTDLVASAQAAPHGDGAHMQPAGLMLDQRQASLTTEDGQASLASSGPDPVFAWILAAGFLGIIVMRRTRGSQPY